MLKGLILRFLFGVAGLWLAAHVVPGISYHGLGSLLAAALLLGVINAVVRPILVILTLPLTLITFGLFLLVINALTLKLVTLFLHGFHVHGFWPAFWGALVVSVASWIGQVLLEPNNR
ncbi:MAG: phage holin family protein [Caulobacteraceae bacterium]